MKKVFSAQDIVTVSHLRNILQGSGIECWIKHEYLSGGAGELPLTECWPELWISDDDLAGRAELLISELRTRDRETGRPWTCPACGEELEGQFTQCWRCGGSRDTETG